MNDFLKKNWLTDFKKINLRNCDDGYDFFINQDCKEWVCQISNFCKKVVGLHPSIQLNAYRSGRPSYISIDLDSLDKKSSVNITVAISGDEIDLPEPADTQFDISLPGIVDTFSLAATIAGTTQGKCIFLIAKDYSFVRDIQDEKQHALMS